MLDGKEKEVAMKGKLFTLTLLLLVGAGTANSQVTLLPGTTASVDATAGDVISDKVLVRCVNLSGRILGDMASTPESVEPETTTLPTSKFFATVNPTTRTYHACVLPGTYDLVISFSRSSGGALTSFTYNDSTPITVTNATDHDFTLQAVTPFAVTGTVSNLIVTAFSKSVTFTSTTIPGFSNVTATSALDQGGNHSELLPNGTYSVELTQGLISSASDFSNLNTALSSSAVVNGTTTLNFTAPTIGIADLSGTVTITGSSMLPANSLLSVADNTTPQPQTISSGSGVLSGTGMYDFQLGTGEKYGFNMDFSITILPPPAPLATWAPPDPSPLTSPLTVNTVHNITLPTLPGSAVPHTISGQVTIAGSGAPVPNATVIAGSSSLSVGPNITFDQIATTDAQGHFAGTVAAGTYSVFYDPGPSALGDFDGIGTANIAVWRPTNGTWYAISNKSPSGFSIHGLSPASSQHSRLSSASSKFLSLSPTSSTTPSPSATSFVVHQWGAQGDIPVPGDYDGDRKTDIAVFRPSNGVWYILPSTNPSAPIVRQWGTQGDMPVPGDYDGDGKADFAVFRPSSGTWFIIPSSNPSSLIIRQWGTQGDIPVPGDYDGDRKTDIAVFRPSNGTWYIMPSSNLSAPIIRQWGAQGDTPVQADYDGDGITDLGVFRPSNGVWYIISSMNPTAPIIQQWGASTDIPVPADYDGDQLADIAVWRPSDGTWYVIPSSAPSTFKITQWGTSGDVPVQKPIGQ
jgi:hypothetical protein